MRACAIIPAFEAERTIADVVRATSSLWAEPDAIIVVDDGSRDGTVQAARSAGAHVLTHDVNRGKGAALRTGMAYALAEGFDVAVTLDADGQHPPAEAIRLLHADDDPDALVLGIRDLEGAGAPRANQISNGISNFFLSVFARRRLLDTQCGLRRYPLAITVGLGGCDDGYAFEAEIILRAIAAKVRVIEAPVHVLYPREEERVTHFDSVRDPARIVLRVVKTLVATLGVTRAPRGYAMPKSGSKRERPSRPRDSSPSAPGPL